MNKYTTSRTAKYVFNKMYNTKDSKCNYNSETKWPEEALEILKGK